MMSSDMLNLYITLALIALVDALSPVRVAVILLLLSGTRPVLRGALFILGIAIFNILFGLLVGQFVDNWPSFEIHLGSLGLIIELLLGVVLLVFAVRTWHTQPAKPSGDKSNPGVTLPPFLSRFTNRILKGGVGLVFVGGMVMELFSLKSLVLFSLGLKNILDAGLSASSQVIALLVFVFLDLLEMIVPTVMFAASPNNSARLLSQMTDWLLRYSYPILAIAEGALALYFIFRGVAGLLN